MNSKRQQSREKQVVPGLGGLQHLHLELGWVCIPSTFTGMKSLEFFLPKLEGLALEICASERENRLEVERPPQLGTASFCIRIPPISLFPNRA